MNPVRFDGGNSVLFQRLMAFVLFLIDDCVCVVSVHKHMRTLKFIEYRADPIQFNRIFFYCLHKL